MLRIDAPPPTEWSLVDTYRGGRYETPEEYVDAYRCYLELRQLHPDAPLSDIAVHLPFGYKTVQNWDVDGAVPMPVQAIYDARDKGWLAPGRNDMTTLLLWRLAGFVYSIGTISTNYNVKVRARGGVTVDELTALFDNLGLDRTVDESDDKPVIRPADHEFVLGRCLVSMGVGIGGEKRESLPDALETADEQARRMFLSAFLRPRVLDPGLKDEYTISFRASDEFETQLVALIDDLTGETAIPGNNAMKIPHAAVEKLGIQ